jgi:hypothetical protein
VISVLKDGLVLKIDGVEMRFYGTLLVMLADTLAAHDLGGFKAGVGRALRKCRQCMATGDDIQLKVSTFLEMHLHAYIVKYIASCQGFPSFFKCRTRKIGYNNIILCSYRHTCAYKGYMIVALCTVTAMEGDKTRG